MEKISSSSPSEPLLLLSGSSVLHLRNGAELPSLIGPFDSLLLCNTAAGKLHLCKCHEEREDRGERSTGATKVTQTLRPLGGHAAKMRSPKLFDEVI